MQLSYFISASIVGLVGGPLLFVPHASVIGHPSLILWSQVATMVCNIWDPLMTGPDEYIPFVLSRLFAGLFGFIPVVLTAGYMMDMYFLHQRGKVFTALEAAQLSGLLVRPSLGGFVAHSKPWPYVFWWLMLVGEKVLA